MNTDEQAYQEQMEALLGPLARHSEYQRGQTVRYRADGMEKVGEITWIVPPGITARGTEHPTEYWIDGLTVVYQTDIIEVLDDESDTAILVRCPYCGTTHSPEAVAWCKQKRQRTWQP